MTFPTGPSIIVFKCFWVFYNYILSFALECYYFLSVVVHDYYFVNWCGLRFSRVLCDTVRQARQVAVRSMYCHHKFPL